MVIIDTDLSLMSGIEKTEWLSNNMAQTKMSHAMRRGVCGVGTNDATYCVQVMVDGIAFRCPAYDTWSRMLKRCYSQKWHEKKPTYVGVSVSTEWLVFSSFREWWIRNQVDGYELDKDLIGCGTQYNASSCIFVPTWLNSFLNDCHRRRGDHPIGVDFHSSKGMFRSRCSNPQTHHNEHVGYFASADEAHKAWMARKLSIANELKPEMDFIDKRIYESVVIAISSAK